MYSTYDVLTIFCNLYHHHLLSYGGRFWKILWVAICERVFTDESKAVLLFHNVLATQEDNIRSSMATSVEKEILLCCGSICFTFISKRLGHAFPSIFVCLPQIHLFFIGQLKIYYISYIANTPHML